MYEAAPKSSAQMGSVGGEANRWERDRRIDFRSAANRACRKAARGCRAGLRPLFDAPHAQLRRGVGTVTGMRSVA